jgi:adenylate cyclase
MYLLRTDHEGPHTYVLDLGRCVIGRSSQADICIAHPSLSRMHATLHIEGDRVTLADLGSKNGTKLNGMMLRGEVPVGPGDTIRLGEIELVLEVVDEAPRFDATIDPSMTWSAAMQESVEELGARVRESAGEEVRLRLLLQIAQQLAHPMSIELTLRTVLKLVAQVLDADRLTVLRLDDGELTTVASIEGGQQLEGQQPWSDSVARMVLREGMAMRFADARVDSRLRASDSVMMQDIRCAVCAPLMHRGQIFGLLYADNRALARVFTHADLELLVAVANQAALALHHAILRDEIAQRAVFEHTLLRFFPPSTARKLVDTGSVLETRELDVTVLFADIAGFTDLSSTLAPLEVMHLLNIFFPAMVAAIQAQEGTLEKYIGDALMAVWGAPFEQPDAADRAVRAAMGMQEAMVEVNAVLAAEGLPKVAIYIGLHSGPVAYGNVGTDSYLQFATVGDTSNVAARVCAAAHAGEVWLTAQTRQRLVGDMVLQDVGEHAFKGKAQPVPLWRVRHP